MSPAVPLALLSMLGFGTAFVLTQFGLRWMPPWLGAAFSIPTSTLLFWLLAPRSLDLAHADIGAAILFACVGVFFPAAVTLLNFESNRLMGPTVSGAVSGMAPLFAVLLAMILLGEMLRPAQAFGIAAIVGGVMLMSRGEPGESRRWPRWMLILPLAAAAIRGAVQPIIKVALARWPDPIAAVVLGYTVSAVVLIMAARVRSGATPAKIDRRGVLWFAAVGVCNGLAVLSLYAALGRGSVALVSPIVASYPLVTLLLSRAVLKHERIGGELMTGVCVTVAGVVLLIATR